MFRYALCLVVPILLLTASGYAENDRTVNEIFDNISHEYVECASYFTIVSQAVKSKGDDVLAAKYEELSARAIEYAVVIAESIRSAEMARKVSLSRYELSVKMMVKEIDLSFSNTSILMNKYALPCKEAMNDPDKFVKTWRMK